MYIIDADVVSRTVQAPGGRAYDALVQGFGPGILQADGTVDRAALGSMIFGSFPTHNTARKRLNAIMHSAIAQECLWQLLVEGGWRGRTVVYDAALMAESGSWLLAWPQVIVLHVDYSVQVDRLVARSGLSRAEAEARIASQAPPARRLAIANTILDNTRLTVPELQAAALTAAAAWV